jgi:hypothetical protein
MQNTYQLCVELARNAPGPRAGTACAHRDERLALFAVEPVLGFSERMEDCFLLLRLNVGRGSVVEPAKHVVNVLLEGILAILQGPVALRQRILKTMLLTLVSLTSLSASCIWFSVGSLEVERPVALEGEHFRRWDHLPAVEDDELGVLVRVAWRLLPLRLDRVAGCVRDREVAHAEDLREHRTGEGGTASDRLVLVERETERLGGEDGLDLGSHGGDARRAADELDRADVVRLDTSLV